MPAGLDTPPALPLQLRHSEREEQEDGTWHYFYDGCAEQRQKEIKSMYEHATNRRDSAGSSVELHAPVDLPTYRWVLVLYLGKLGSCLTHTQVLL